jgi:hypothetical protein
MAEEAAPAGAVSDPTSDIARRTRRCKICREEGHRRDSCPKRFDMLADLDAEAVDPIAEAALSRERIDGLIREIKDYEHALKVIGGFLDRSRVQLALERQKLAVARSKRS